MAASMMGTYGNLLACLESPTLHTTQTIEKMFHWDGESVRHITFKPPLAALGRVGGDINGMLRNVLTGLTRQLEIANVHDDATHIGWIPKPHDFACVRHLLSFQTVIVKFSIGHHSNQDTPTTLTRWEFLR
jgi:hypothetical protein